MCCAWERLLPLRIEQAGAAWMCSAAARASGVSDSSLVAWICGAPSFTRAGAGSAPDVAVSRCAAVECRMCSIKTNGALRRCSTLTACAASLNATADGCCRLLQLMLRELTAEGFQISLHTRYVDDIHLVILGRCSKGMRG